MKSSKCQGDFRLRHFCYPRKTARPENLQTETRARPNRRIICTQTFLYSPFNFFCRADPAHRRGRPGVSLEIHAAVDNSIRREPQYLFSEGSGAVYLLLHLERQHGRYNPVDALGLQHRRKRTCRPAVFHKSERSRKSCHKKEFMIENIVNRQYNTP